MFAYILKDSIQFIKKLLCLKKFFFYFGIIWERICINLFVCACVCIYNFRIYITNLEHTSHSYTLAFSVIFFNNNILLSYKIVLFVGISRWDIG